MDCIGPVCKFIFSPLIQPLACQVNCIRKANKNLEMLQEIKGDLIVKKNDINGLIERHAISMIRTEQCTSWIEKVNQIEVKVNGMQDEFDKGSKCLGDCCPPIWECVKLGKSIVIMIDHATQVKNETPSKEWLMVDAPLPVVERTPVPFIIGQSAKQIIEDILGSIKDEKIMKIGVWGIGGVGKTTMMKNLENLPEISQMFEIVIWVTVSKDWSFRKVQKDIMKRLSLKFEEDDANGTMASKIFQKLEKMKYLLLLDDVWQMVDLQKVGVPSFTKKNGCKMVLTSRLLSVCNQMSIDKELQVKGLLKDEAWDLFRESCGEVVDSVNIKETAIDIVKECDGLPLALIVVAKPLTNVNDEFIWKSTLDELRLATFDIGDMQERVFKILKTSYDRLRDEDVKNCFLYCALYPEDFEISIHGLIEYWRVEGFIRGTESLEKAYNKGRRILNDLITASLLEGVFHKHGKFVKMHDIIRDLALKITSQESDGPRYFVRAGVGINVCPDAEEWEHINKISLMKNNLRILPQKPQCNTLTTLFLQNNHLKEVPTLFFEHMCHLRVLNLSYTGAKRLPPSISHLVHLRGLYLMQHINLMTLPCEIGALKELEVLRVGYIEYFPIEVGQLARLKSLRVWFHNRSQSQYEEDQPQDDDSNNMERKMGLMMIPVGMISNLHLLEDFKVDVLNVNQNKWNENVDAMVEEMGKLKLLSSLKFHFPRIEHLERFITKRSLFTDEHFTSLEVLVGKTSGGRMLCNHENERALQWTEGDGVTNAMQEMLNQACNFELIDHHTIQSLLEFGIENLNGLHKCRIRGCHAMKSIIDGNHLIDKTALPNLDSLFLVSLASLITICKGPMLYPVIPLLTNMTVTYCGKLGSIFSPGVIQHFSKLKLLKVENCQEVEEIIVNEGKKESIVLLPSLKSLTLTKLPKLIRICEGDSQNWPLLETIEIVNCPNLKTLPFSMVSNDVPNLKHISGEKEWWGALKWRDEEAKQQFQPFFHLPREW